MQSKVTMPLRAFLLFERPYEALYRPRRHTVTMPLRAFLLFEHTLPADVLRSTVTGHNALAGIFAF